MHIENSIDALDQIEKAIDEIIKETTAATKIQSVLEVDKVEKKQRN